MRRSTAYFVLLVFATGLILSAVTLSGQDVQVVVAVPCVIVALVSSWKTYIWRRRESLFRNLFEGEPQFWISTERLRRLQPSAERCLTVHLAGYYLALNGERQEERRLDQVLSHSLKDNDYRQGLWLKTEIKRGEYNTICSDLQAWGFKVISQKISYEERETPQEPQSHLARSS